MDVRKTEYFTPAQMRRLVDSFQGKDPGPFKNAPDEAQEAGVQDVIIVRGPRQGDLSKGVDPSQMSEELKAKGVEVQEPLDKVGVTARVDEATARRLEEEGYILYDNSPRPLWPGLPRPEVMGKDWSMPRIDPVALVGADKLQAQGITGKGQVVAVLDSGFQHPETPLLAWKDVVEGSAQPVDPVGHGTHVAGDVLQVAPGARIVAVRVMDEQGQGRPSDIIRGIQWAIQNKDKYGIEVINMSLGAGPDGLPDRFDPINKAVEAATRAGITVVAAAGNSGPDGRTIGSPADAASALTVGAALDKHKLSDFSSRGPTDDGLVKPDVVAPGEYITSWSVPGSAIEQTGQVVEKLRAMSGAELKKLLEAKPQLVAALGLPRDILRRPDAEVEDLVKSSLPPIYIPEPGKVAAPGTSFAAPLVAGVVASLEEIRDEKPLTLKQLVRDTADPLGNYGPNEQGQGFINAEKAARRLKGQA
ncbi:MAG TPA: S8 family serine peptidase [Candidatus Nitrosotenuis sp.]|nr:S8 family serine peptidase [Candidatus Nitrosotenuis sp.]